MFVGALQFFFFLFLSSLDDIIFLLLFRERGEGGEREAWICGLPVCAVTWEWTHNLGMCPDQESNPQPFKMQTLTVRMLLK